MTTKMKQTNHKRLQHYEHHYGMVCLTGLLGCRWHRYQQSQASSTKCDIGWYVTLMTSSAFVLFWFYFWLLADNSSSDINWYMYGHFGKWKSYYSILFILTCTTIAYASVLNILALCHVGHHHQVHIHWTHKLTIVIILAFCVAAAVAVSEVWSSGWRLQSSSLMITSPFLHLSAVTLMTLITWFIAAKWMTLYRTISRVLYLGFYIALMLFLYLVPLLIHSPCIVEVNALPSKPTFVGHRGLPALRPENTEYSFQTSREFVDTYESDVLVSFDGIPFLMHDKTLRRTTDVEHRFPDKASLHPCWFNISQIETLDAGSWYLQTDPFKQLKSLSEEERDACVNQSVPRLSWLLHETNTTNKTLLFDIIGGCSSDHPYNFVDTIIDTIDASGINPKKIWWLSSDLDTRHEGRIANMTLVYRLGHLPSPSPDDLRQNNYEGINTDYGLLSVDDVRAYHDAEIWVNVFVVDSAWMFSLYWCMGVDSVTTNNAEYLGGIGKPVWSLTPQQFRAMWITTDVVSAALVILLFVIQHLRRYSKTLKQSIHSERLSLQGAKIRMSHLRKNRNMKEKLLHTVEGLQEVDPGFLGMSSDNLAVDSCHGDQFCNGDADRASPHPCPQPSTLSVSHLTPNRISRASGWSNGSGISEISAISGCGVGDASFNTAPSGDETEQSYQNRDTNMTEVTLEVPT